MATCKLSDVNPVVYIAETLEAVLNGHPQSRIEDLMPWRFRKTSSPDAQGIAEALTDGPYADLHKQNAPSLG